MNSILSDFNKPGYIPGNYSKSAPIYSDLDFFFDIHPMTGDLVPLTDTDAVKASVKNLVLTQFYERPFQPDLGSRVRGMLFENADQFTAIAIREEIEELIREQEPRIQGVQVDVTDNSDSNEYRVTVNFNIAYGAQDTIDFILKRLR